VINIKNLATCFGSNEPSSGQIWKHSPGIFRECINYAIPYCHLLFNTDHYIYSCVIDWNKLYYFNTQRDGSYILIFSNYSTQVSTQVSNAFNKPHFLMSDLYAWLWRSFTREENFLISSVEKQWYLDSYLEMPNFMQKKMSSVHGYGQDKVWKCWLSLSLVGGYMQNCLPMIQCHLKQCPLVCVLWITTHS